MTKIVSPEEALIYVMVSTSAADRTMTDSELMKIGEEVQTLPVFSDFDHERLVTVSRDCSDLLAEGGVDLVLKVVRASLPIKLRETAYALAIEVAAADLQVEQDELQFLLLLRDELELDRLHVGAIEHSARVRYRRI
ncbi:Tellurite resistance protein TerB [Cohaesibacter marisflavi]|uniref:Tellurite resistance protein TerB n=1 Tax=Cohaesibacter marisflavi TaxID=655353 RepID=A0A1I5D8F3_9HYPH|nr:tellurite resistance TerB family protein [Cohaesibacter marisflavi]SFN95473.1 Tellurite resistance protein TerB [Cohaesibacter marisflavi]